MEAQLTQPLLSVSRSAFYKYVPELKPGSVQQIEADVPEPRPDH